MVRKAPINNLDIRNKNIKWGSTWYNYKMGEEFPSGSDWWLDILGWNGYYLEWSWHQGYQYVYLFLHYDNILLVNWHRGLLPGI